MGRTFGACIGVSAAIAACSGPGEPKQQKIADPSVPAESSDDGAARKGKLAPPPKTMTLGQFWPTKVCTRGPNLIVVANTCVCDSHMTCAPTWRGNVLDLRVGMKAELCKDCGTFLAACDVPAEARARGKSARTVRVTLDGKPLLDALELPRSDAPAVERCYE